MKFLIYCCGFICMRLQINLYTIEAYDCMFIDTQFYKPIFSTIVGGLNLF